MTSEHTVRTATFDVLRRLELTTIFSNPGSTEVPFLAGLPDDLEFVLALHEGSAVAMAAGSRDRPRRAVAGAPALTPGLGNAVAALATARQNRAPVVVLVGQQDRRHLALEPFLAGRLQGLAGDYPVWVDQPMRPQDVPGSVARAYHEAATGRGPAIVIVPMDDWAAPGPEPHEALGPDAPAALRGGRARRASTRSPTCSSTADAPALVVGAGADGEERWAALVELAERLGCPVWQEPFGGQAGFPQDHPRFAGHLPARRARLREVLSPHDTLLVVGAGAFRQYPYDEGPLVEPGTRIAIVTQDPAEAHRSPADLTVLGEPAVIFAALAAVVDARPAPNGPPAAPRAARAARRRRAAARRPRARRAGGAAAARRDPARGDAVSRPELHARIPATAPLGFISAMGMLGFAVPAAIGVRMARQDRPVLAVVGDGSSLYQITALWSAASYGVGVLFVVLVNGGYAIMDRLAERNGSAARGRGWTDRHRRAGARAGLRERARLDPRRAARAARRAAAGARRPHEPLLLEVVVAQDATFDP